MGYQELKKDLNKFLDPKKGLKKPEYYLYVTNLPLTAVPDTGSKDRVLTVLDEYKPKLDLKGYDVWSYDELCRFIDDNESIRNAYLGFITTGDILNKIQLSLRNQWPNFEDAMGSFLQKELLNDYSARLESTGKNFENQISLAQVFIDLPVTEHAQFIHPPNQIPSSQHISGGLINDNNVIANLIEFSTAKTRNGQVELIEHQDNT